MNKENYYTAQETAERLPNVKLGGYGVAYSYLRSHKKSICKKYGLKFKKIGNANYFLKSEVDKL
jgi:hypothetical protein